MKQPVVTKRVVLAYLALLIILLGGAYWAAYNATYTCWDGIQVDEALLMELCGITEEEYWAMDPADCPQSVEAVEMIGGCEPDGAAIVTSMVVVALLYTLIFWSAVWVWGRAKGR